MFLILAACGVGYLVANVILDQATASAITYLRGRSGNTGVELISADFVDVGITSLDSATWRGLEARLRLTDTDIVEGTPLVAVGVGSVTVRLVGNGRAVVEASNIRVGLREDTSLRESASGAPVQSASFDGDLFRTELAVDLFNPIPGVERAFRDWVSLAQTGQTTSSAEFEGTARFVVRDTDCEARIRLEDEGRYRALVLNTDDVRLLASTLDQDLTEAEVSLIAKTPIRAPKLFAIRDDAETTAADARRQDTAVAEDAYRHVLWSYLLTNEFDATFAEEVTNAHEEGSTSNTEAERRMDYHNNGIGRTFAGAGVPRSEILSRVMNDPRVIRAPR